MRKHLDLILILTICFTTTLSCVNDAQHTELLIKGITIINVDLGTTQESKDIAITNGKIQAIGEDLRGSSKTVILDGNSLFALPGLWDMHVHTAAKEIFFPLYLVNGVTGVRDMGGDHQYGTGNVSISIDSLTAWRTAIQRGELLGPRLIITGPIIDGPDPVYPGLTTPINTEQEAREMVRSLVNRDADFTKVYSNLTPELYKALADESNQQGIPFAGHVPKSVSAYEASELGQKSMEHLRQIIEKYDDSITDDLLLTLRRNQSWQTPTLTVYRDYKRGDGLEFMDDPRLNYIPEDIRQRWAKSPWWHEPRTDSARIHQLMTWNRRLETVKRMQSAGVPLLAGSDAANPYTYPGFSLHDELEEMVAAGLTTAEVLRIATLAPAEFLEATDSIGTIAPGKVADLILLSANPLVNINNIKQIEAVVTRGRLLNRSDLDSMLADVAHRVK